jgi:hypothetical protein
MASTITFDQFSQAHKFFVNLKMAKDPQAYAKILKNKVFSNDADSPKQIMARFGDQVLNAVLVQYDSTRSTKNTRNRTGHFRSLITRQGPFMNNFADITVTVGAKLEKAPLWRILEHGVSPKLRIQGYQVVGAGSRGDLSQIAQFSFKHSPSSTTFSAKDFQGGIKLIPRKKEELARIRRKIFLQFVHPGFAGGKFIRAGVIYALTNASPYINTEIDKMFDNVVAQSNAL